MSSIRVFISHPDEDWEMAKKLEESMKRLRMDTFLTPHGIKVGKKWREVIRTKIKECNIMVALITPNFKKAAHADQEVGAAWVLEKPVLSVLVGDMKPHGFIDERQGIPYDVKFVGNTACEILEFALSEVVDKEANLGNKLAQRLITSISYYESNCLAKLLYRQKPLTDDQISDVRKALKTNPQVNDDDVYEKAHLLDLIHEHDNDG